MAKHPYARLSRREREIMDILYRLGSATANDIIAELQESRHSSTVRTQLRLLEEKGQVSREPDGHRYLYKPTVAKAVVRRSALKHLVDTFFDGSTEKAVSTLLSSRDQALSDEDVERLTAMIERAARDESQ